jgi:uncharacterized OB-fold protein
MNDWTAGTGGIAYQRCASCLHLWYFRRGFCPRCGSAAIAALQSAGSGIVYAVTEVLRAPSEQLKAYAPYWIALVDVDEGFRMMAHVEPGARIGERVHARFLAFGGATIPVFTRTTP